MPMKSPDSEHGTSVSENFVQPRSGIVDRRRMPRGGRRFTDKVRTAVFATTCALAVSPMVAAADASVKFGFDANSTKRAQALGMPVSYGSLWVGSWNQKEKYGW